MHAVMDLLKELNQKQDHMPAFLSGRVDGWEREKNRRDEILNILKTAGFSVIFHKEVGKWMLYYEDREA